MTLHKRIISLVFMLTLSIPAFAMNLNEAMSALGSAKTSGQLGETPTGYLGVLKPGGNTDEIAKLINDARRNEYKKLAEKNGIEVSAVEAIAGKKAIEKTPPGQYIQVDGKWVKK